MKKSTTVLAAVSLAGVAITATAVWLLTSKKGKTLRNKVAREANEVFDAAKKKIVEIRETAACEGCATCTKKEPKTA